MARSNAYGQDFGRSFGLSEAPALISRALKKNEIAITEVGSDNPVARPTDRFARHDAYLVGVQLRAFPHHEYWEDGRRAPVSDLAAGATTFNDLQRDPVAPIDKPYHAIFFYIPRSTFEAIADDTNATRISELNYKPGVGVADRTTLCLAQSMLAARDHPERASRLFLDHVSLVFAAHVAGATTVASVFAADAESIRKFGADSVIESGAKSAATLEGSVDAVLDLIGGAFQGQLFEYLRPGGVLVSAVSAPDAALAQARGVRAAFFLVDVTTADLDSVVSLVEHGRLRVSVGQVLQLESARRAHEMLDGLYSKPSGKIVLEVHRGKSRT